MYHAKLFAALVLVAVALVAGELRAAPVKLLLLDDMSCASWMRAGVDPEQQLPYIQWIRGFLSGHNYANQARQVAVISNGTIVQFIERHCRSNPAGNLADAAMRMSDQFSGRNAAITK